MEPLPWWGSAPQTSVSPSDFLQVPKTTRRGRLATKSVLIRPTPSGSNRQSMLPPLQTTALPAIELIPSTPPIASRTSQRTLFGPTAAFSANQGELLSNDNGRSKIQAAFVNPGEDVKATKNSSEAVQALDIATAVQEHKPNRAELSVPNILATDGQSREKASGHQKLRESLPVPNVTQMGTDRPREKKNRETTLAGMSKDLPVQDRTTWINCSLDQARTPSKLESGPGPSESSNEHDQLAVEHLTSRTNRWSLLPVKFPYRESLLKFRPYFEINNGGTHGHRGTRLRSRRKRAAPWLVKTVVCGIVIIVLLLIVLIVLEVLLNRRGHKSA